jgi:hypothetical protein
MREAGMRLSAGSCVGELVLLGAADHDARILPRSALM